MCKCDLIINWAFIALVVELPGGAVSCNGNRLGSDDCECTAVASMGWSQERGN